MSIITKYISRRLIFYYFAFLMVLMAFFVFVDFMEHIDRVTKYDAPLSLIGLYYLYFLPRVFIEMSWLSFLVAMLFVLGSIAKNNEFTAMLAGGISIHRTGAPILVIGLLISLLVFGIQELIMPYTMLKASDIERNNFTLDSEEPTLHDIAGLGKRNKFYFIDSMNVKKNVLSGVHIHETSENRIIETIDADKAVWDDATERWILNDGIIRKFNERGVVTEILPFTDMKAPFKEPPRTLAASSSEQSEFNFRQLRRKIKNLKRSGYDARRLRVDYHVKFSLPLMNLIVVLLGLPFALECRRGGLTVGFALSLITALLYYGTFQISLSLGRGDIFPAAAAAWTANFLFFGIGIALTMRART